MCLVLNKKCKRPQTASNSVICYKILIENDDGLITPITKAPVDRKIVIGVRQMKAFGPQEIETIKSGDVIVSSGFIHTYKSPVDALLKINTDKDSEKMHLFKCKIPAGVFFCSGSINGGANDGYASESIIFINEIKFRIE